MKKTMLALMATVGLAFGAKADDVAYGGSTNFENATPGKLTVDDYWGTVAEDDDSKYVAYETAPDKHAALYAADATNEKYLAVETGSNVLLRSARPGMTSNFEELFFDTLVQFTASDDDVDRAEGDKLIVWMKATEAKGEPGDEDYVPAATNLMITAGVVNAPNYYANSVTNYTVAGNYQAGEWYRLTVKTYEDIGLPAKVPGFRVFIDGEEVTVTGAELYNGYFASMVSRAGGPQTLTGIGFKGTGAVDDIAMTSYDPIPVVAPTTVALTVTLTDENFAFTELAANAEVVDVEDPAPIVADVNDVITFVAKVADGFTPTVAGYVLQKSAEKDEDDCYAYTFTATVTQEMIDGGLQLVIEVTEDGGGGEEVPESAEVVADGGKVTVKAASEEAALEAVTVKGVDGEVYADSQKYYTKAATPNGDNWDVTVALDTVTLKADVDDAVEAALEAVVAGGATTKTVGIPAGFCYKIEFGTTVGLTSEPLRGTSTGSVEMPALGKDAGFFKVSVDTTSFEAGE